LGAEWTESPKHGWRNVEERICQSIQDLVFPQNADDTALNLDVIRRNYDGSHF
jgi:hypothetical protein